MILEKKPPIDLSVHVLTTGYWPVTQSTKCNIPVNVDKSCNYYKDFYLTGHSGRKITWQFNMGTADVRANGFLKKYELNVSTYQMLILILFNTKEEYTYSDILNTTKIAPAEVKKNLLALTVKSKTHDKILSKDTTSLTKDTKITANNDFKSKSIKVKILPVVLKETKEELEDTQQKLDEERKWTLDATIVRIMKARKNT